MGQESWCVGRGEFGSCYVSDQKTTHGEVEFTSELEAVEYAILCDEDVADAIRRTLRLHRTRRRALMRMTTRHQRRDREERS